jgi:hypothetical protein
MRKQNPAATSGETEGCDWVPLVSVELIPIWPLHVSSSLTSRKVRAVLPDNAGGIFSKGARR